ncbi:unnamed protein product [Anisakis simplex]|uniref:Afadin (inferred by orthology to a human protein) n=1 Tax=Anisakis simplex TaxID=6269 RepID=A0A0M3JRZ3_ANISI|nr:unnamed protein product [Anisakis simplex]
MMFACNRPASSVEHREQLWRLVEQWNENRLDLFNLSYPNEDLEIHGVMRFYYQESNNKVLTKCIRVSSTATTRAVIEALVERFHPDLKMLSDPDYSLWEVHENGEERCLSPDERPLLVQLNWHSDDREGRFLLRKHDRAVIIMNRKTGDENKEIKRSQKRFSKREKKELKKKHQRAIIQDKEDASTATKSLYKALPPTTFTRTISNPEIVMKKRRERKLEAKLKEMGHGGSLKVYGYELMPSRPYVTLLVSLRDQATKIVRETLDKYGLDKENVDDYVLVRVRMPSSCKMSRSLSDLRSLEDGASHEEYVDPNDYPLLNLDPDVIFLVRRRVNNIAAAVTNENANSVKSLSSPHHKSYTSTSANVIANISDGAYANLIPASSSYHPKTTHFSSTITQLPPLHPHLIPLTSDGRSINERIISLNKGITEIGSANAVDIQLIGELIWPRHAAITFSSTSAITITPSVPNALIEATLIFINGEAIHETVILRSGDMLTIGRFNRFRYLDEEVSKASITIRDNFRLSPAPRGVSGFGSTPDLNEAFQRTTAQTANRFSSEEIPAVINVPTNVEDTFLSHIFSEYTEALQFKLSPAFIFYMVLRHRFLKISPINADSVRSIRFFAAKAIQRIRSLLLERTLSKEMYAFWMANSSEMLNFIKQDLQLKEIIEPSTQQLFLECVEYSLNGLSGVYKDHLNKAIDSFIDCRIDDRLSSDETIRTLNDAVYVLRMHRINAALTIQLFSQLFYFISSQIFNWLVSPNGSRCCSTAFGVRLSNRLNNIHNWAKQQGMELPAICHMDKIQQAISLLVTQKTSNQISVLGATCYKLNSVQVRYLLEHIVVDVNEDAISNDLIESLVQLAETQADRIAIEDGIGVNLEENPNLQTPFLLPEDGYCSGVLYSVPPSVTSFIGTLQQKGLCELLPQVRSSTGSWMVHFNENTPQRHMPATVPVQQRQPLQSMQLHASLPQIAQSQTTLPTNHSSYPHNGYASMQSLNNAQYSSNAQPLSNNFLPQKEHVPHIVQISFSRGNAGIGLSIVAAQGIGERSVGIYVKKVVDGSAAHRDGRLEPGDQLVSINGQSLVGITQSEAAEMMSRSGPVVSFEVNKNAAHYNGLEEWLRNPPPQSQSSTSAHLNSTQPVHNVAPRHAESVSSLLSENYANQQSFDKYQRPTVVTNSNNAYNSTRYNPTPTGMSYNRNEPAHHLYSRRNEYSLPDSNLRTTRCNSTSELYHSKVEISLRTYFLGSQDSMGTVSSMQSPFQKHRALPPHYRVSQRPVIIQPARSAQQRSQSPNAIASTINHQESSSVGVVSDGNAQNAISSSTLNTTRRDELNARLDKLEAKGTAMNENERRTYRAMVDELARVPLKRPQNLFTSPQPQTTTVENKVEESRNDEQLDKLLEDVKQQMNQIDVTSDNAASISNSVRALATSTPSPPHQIDNEDSTKSKKKGVQWKNDAVEKRSINATASVAKDDSNTKLLYNDDESSEPRVQVLGAQEVYRDPRQRRLNEIQARQNASNVQVDGANLGFKDKMRLFAEQLGEKTPKARYKCSSAQREIEQSNDSS